MRLKSQQQWQSTTNQRLTQATHVVQIWIGAPKLVVAGLLLICLLTKSSLGHVTRSATKARIVSSQLLDKASGANEDCDCGDGAYHRPHFTRGRSVLVQLFEWKFVDIAEECRTFLGPQGYAGVQLSPVLEHTIIKTDALQHPWWQRYETVSYRLASRSGDETDFWSMSRICNDHGVRIYVDVVLNHMAAPLQQLLENTSGVKATEVEDFVVNTLLSQDVNISNSNYPEVPYTSKDFHRPCSIPDTASADEIRNCQPNGHPDLDHSHLSVRQSIVKMLNKFIDMGVAGFRIDTAKLVWPIDLKLIYAELQDLNTEFNFEANTRPFIYHDVFDMGLDSISKTEYATYGVVSEYLFPAQLSIILSGKAPLSSFINWGPAMGFLSHQDSLVFVDSHDTQRGLPKDLGQNRMLTYKQRHKYIMANALMLAHPYGRIKRIMSSYYFDTSNINQGPPSEESDIDAIRSPEFNDQQQCVASSGWVCEHRWPPLVQLVKMANYFSVPGQEEESVIHFQTNGPNHIAFCRGYKAFVAMNNDAERDFQMMVYTCLEEGVYCDVVSGGLMDGGEECHGRSLKVNADGYANLSLTIANGNVDETEGLNFSPLDDGEEGDDGDVVENFGVLVIYVGSKIGFVNEVEEFDVKGDNGEVDVEDGVAEEDPVAEEESVTSMEEDEVPAENNEEETSPEVDVGNPEDTETESDKAEGEETEAVDVDAPGEDQIEDSSNEGVPEEDEKPADEGGDEPVEDETEVGEGAPEEGKEEDENSADGKADDPADPVEEDDGIAKEGDEEAGVPEEEEEGAEDLPEEDNEVGGEPESPEPGGEDAEEGNEDEQTPDDRGDPEDAQEEPTEDTSDDEVPVADEGGKSDDADEGAAGDGVEEPKEDENGNSDAETPDEEPPEAKSNEEAPAEGEADETADPQEESENEQEQGAESDKDPEEKQQEDNEIEADGGEEVEDGNEEVAEENAEVGDNENKSEENAEADEKDGETVENVGIPENPMEKIDKRETADEDAEQQVESPIITDDPELSDKDPEENQPEINTQESIELINSTGITELQILANDTKVASVKNDDIAVAGVFPLTKSRQENG